MNESNDIFKISNDNSVFLQSDNSLCFVPRNLKQFEIPSNCKTIHSGTFCGPILEEVKFEENSITCIENAAFAHSTSLKEIKIPKSTTFIGEETFIQCESLEKVEFDLDCQIKDIPKFCFAFSSLLKTVILPPSIEIIDHSSFLLCQNLKFINLHETKVKYISDYAFSHTSIEEIKLPSSVDFIGSHILDGNKSLNLIDLTELKEIDELKRFPKNIPLLIQQNDDSIESKDENVLLKPLKSSTIHFDNQKQIIQPKISMNKSSNNVVLKTNSPQIIKPSVNKQLTNKSTIKNSGSLLTPTQLPSIESNIIVKKDKDSKCFIHSFAFCNSSVKTLKVNLTKYKWYNFINNFSQIDEFVVNDEIHLILQKNNNDKFKRFVGSSFDVKSFIFENVNNSFNLTPFHFVDCSKLTSITIGEEIKINEIPKNCFSFSFLQEMTIPSSIQIINEHAFKCCYYLEKIVIPNNSLLEKIKREAFCECKNLTSFYIPNKLKVIPKKCFSFTALERIDLGNSINKINSYAFYGCKKLKEVNLNNGIIEIGSFSFANNSSLEIINLPDSLKTIKNFAFSYCTNLCAVKTTENTQLIEINNGAFEKTQIEEIGLNKSAIKLFEPSNVSKLNKITFYKGNPENFIQLEDGTIYEKTSKLNDIDQSQNLDELESNIIQNILLNQSNNFINNRELYLSNMKIALIKNQLNNKHSLLNLVFAPKNLECLKIHEDCFSFNNSVIDDMKNLTTIEYMKGLTNSVINFPNYNHSFNNIKHIKILGEFAFIEESVFHDFESLETVEFSDSTNVLFIPKFAFLRCKNLQKIIIPSSCISIEEGSFKDCINLRSIEFKENSKIRFIGKSSFYNCTSLESILIPSSINSICSNSFMNCTKLAKFEFETNQNSQNQEWLKIIQKNAFKNCSSLLSFILPKTCVELGPAVFMNCTSLEKFEYEGTELKSIPCRAFYNCSSLKKIELINVQFKLEYKRFGLKSITIFPFSIGDESFMNCSSLKEVIIEDESKTVKLKPILKKLKYPPLIKNFKRQTIRKNAFCNCKSLEKARFFLGNLERFHANSFMNCESLKLIEINSNFWNLVVNENLDSSAFVGTPKDLQIKIFDGSSYIETIENFNGKPIHLSQKKLFNNHLSSLNKSFFDWNIQEENKVKKIKSTCINTFDGPKFKSWVPYKKVILKIKKNEQIQYYYCGFSDPLKNVIPIHLKSRFTSKLTLFNDDLLVKPDENGRIKKPDIIFYGFKVPVFRSNNEIYKESLSKLNKSFLTWTIKDDDNESKNADNQKLLNIVKDSIDKNQESPKSINEEQQEQSKQKQQDPSKQKTTKKIPEKKTKT